MAFGGNRRTSLWMTIRSENRMRFQIDRLNTITSDYSFLYAWELWTNSNVSSIGTSHHDWKGNAITLIGLLIIIPIFHFGYYCCCKNLWRKKWNNSGSQFTSDRFAWHVLTTAICYQYCFCLRQSTAVIYCYYWNPFGSNVGAMNNR